MIKGSPSESEFNQRKTDIFAAAEVVSSVVLTLKVGTHWQQTSSQKLAAIFLTPVLTFASDGPLTNQNYVGESITG